MNKLKQSIIDSMRKETILFASHQKEIARLNGMVLRFISVISSWIFVLLCLLHIVINRAIDKLGFIYIVVIVFMIILNRIFIKKRSHHMVLCGIYMSFIIFFLITLYLGVFIFPQSLGVSILGLLLLLPFIIIDKTWRVNTVVVFFYLIFIMSSFIYKDVNIALDDMVVCGIYMVIGMVFGQYLNRIKLDNITTRDTFKKLSHTDALTHLYNRRKLENFMCSPDVEKHMSGVIMIDIDFFKQYNDTYGHQQGDRCLEEVAACLYRIAKQNQLNTFRYGGEEFVIISVSHTYEELCMIANDIKDSVMEMELAFEESPHHYLTISAGVSDLIGSKASDAYDLVDKADKALYQAKSDGRNRVVGYSYVKDN